MARNGTGTYSLLVNSWNPAVNGVTATAADWQNLINDVAAAITQSVSSDGQTPMTGNLAMGNNKITGLAAGTANTDAVNLGQVSSNVGQCRLLKSGANLVLLPYQGNRLTINGTIYTIPSAGVSLAPTGSVATTLYYIYAYMVGAVMTLEYSTTSHSTDTATGVEIKTGDATRSLVGMARPITGPAWQDTVTQRFVVSWFNRRQVYMTAGFTTTRTTASGTFVEVNTEIRNEMLCWAFDAIQTSIMGSASSALAGAFCQTVVGFDGSATDSLSSNRQAAAGGIDYPVASTFYINPAEGYHYVTLFGKVTGGTGTWYGGSGGDRCVCTSLVLA